MTERSNAVASVRPLDPEFEKRRRAARRVTKQFVYALPADEWTKVEITHQDPSYDAPVDFSLSDMTPEDAIAIYNELYPETSDRSKRDWRIAWNLLATGFPPGDAAAVIYFGSGHAHEHSDPEGYAVRTVAKSMEAMS